MHPCGCYIGVVSANWLAKGCQDACLELTWPHCSWSVCYVPIPTWPCPPRRGPYDCGAAARSTQAYGSASETYSEPGQDLKSDLQFEGDV